MKQGNRNKEHTCSNVQINQSSAQGVCPYARLHLKIFFFCARTGSCQRCLVCPSKVAIRRKIKRVLSCFLVARYKCTKITYVGFGSCQRRFSDIDSRRKIKWIFSCFFIVRYKGTKVGCSLKVLA